MSDLNHHREEIVKKLHRMAPILLASLMSACNAPPPQPSPQQVAYQTEQAMAELGKTYETPHAVWLYVPVQGRVKFDADNITIVEVHPNSSQNMFKIRTDKGEEVDINWYELNEIKKQEPAAIAIHEKERRPPARIGMTLEQVIQSSWGAPIAVVKTVTAKGEVDKLSYNGGVIYLTNGVVTEIKTR